VVAFKTAAEAPRCMFKPILDVEKTRVFYEVIFPIFFPYFFPKQDDDDDDETDNARRREKSGVKKERD
jgi:hypothetical protein